MGSGKTGNRRGVILGKGRPEAVFANIDIGELDESI